MGMSVSTVRKMKVDSYAFSWSLPAGGEGSESAGTVLHSIPLADESNPDSAQATSEAVQLEGGTVYASPYEASSRFEAPSPRFMGVLAWSAIAGSGLVGAVMKFGGAFGVQAGEIGGLWVALAAAIWLVPPKLIGQIG